MFPHTRTQALNVVLEQMLEGHPVSERKLKEVLGHTPRQVGGRPCLFGYVFLVVAVGVVVRACVRVRAHARFFGVCV